MLFFVFLVWLMGSVIAGVYNNIQSKRQCAERETWIKNTFGCPGTSNEKLTTKVVKAALWPVAFLKTEVLTGNANTPQLTSDQFEGTRAGTIYTCLSIANTSERVDDAKALSQTIHSIQMTYPEMRRSHDDFTRLAMNKHTALGKTGNVEKYYASQCLMPVEEIKRIKREAGIRL